MIALLTDYGNDDFFVASLRGVILSIQPGARIVDISHSVRSFDIRQASYLLGACYSFFPAGTIFVVVVDPGVGSGRRLLLAETKRYFFIAPDNGVLSDVLGEERPKTLIDITNSRFFLKSAGRTFDGRDKMAPVAAWLSLGRAAEEFGSKISTWKTFPSLKPECFKDRIRGHIVYIDKFGNCLTNIPSGWAAKLEKKLGTGGMKLAVGEKLAAWSPAYSAGRKGKLIFLPGSQGTIEIAVKQNSAAALIGAVVGDPVLIFSRDMNHDGRRDKRIP